MDVSCFDATADGSMVRVDMIDGISAKNNPAGQFIDVDQALFLEAQGKCRIRRKIGADMVSGSGDGKTMVEYLEQALIDSYGKYGVYKQKDAELGEKVGKWKIVKDPSFPLSYISVEEEQYKKRDHETKGIKKARVAWVQDNFILGGAELSNRLVTRIGLDCGYAIDLVTPSTNPQAIELILGQSDLVVINNIFGFEKEQMRALLKGIYSERKPYVKYEHDHRELRRSDFSRRLFQNSRLNVFLSPIHLKNYQEALGCEGIVLPLAIDVDLFKPVESIERKKDSAVVCNVRNFKSWTNLQKYIDDNPKIEFIVMAENPVVSGPNVKARPKVPYEKMPELYSGFEYVVHILDGWGAGERVVFEGTLCGCKIVANSRVGHTSWNKDLTNTNGLREWLRVAPYQFWKEIDGKVLC